MNDTIDLEYTAIERPLPPAIPIRDIRALVIAVDLTAATDDICRAVNAVAAWLAAVDASNEAR